MGKIRDYIFLHLSVFCFPLPAFFPSRPPISLMRADLETPCSMCLFFLCFWTVSFTPLCWQKVIKRFDLNIGYANRSVYLLWSQIWAVLFLRRNSDAPEYHWTSGGAGRGCDCISKREKRKEEGIEHGTISTDYVCGDFFYSHLSGAAEAERREKILPVDF